MPNPAPREERPLKLFQFKVTLVGSASVACKVWRRVVAHKDMTLLEFHAVLQGAMGWENRHLHEFTIASRTYSTPDELEPEGPALDGYLDERGVILADAISDAREFHYRYDLGDVWDHVIEIESAKSFPSSAVHLGAAICLDGQGACPPEDCGGISGYSRLLRALVDSDHPERKELLTWHGRFDPFAFSAVQATTLIAAWRALYHLEYDGEDPADLPAIDNEVMH